MNKSYRTFIFCIITALYWFSAYAFIPILSPYAKSLGSSDKMVGLIIGSYGFMQMLLRIPLGIFSDTIKKRKIFIIIGILLSVISTLGMWYTKTPLFLLFFRALSGVSAATWVIFIVLYTSYFEQQYSSKAIGVLTSYNYSGQVVAMLLGGIIAQQFSQQYTFLLASLGATIGLILSFAISENVEVNKRPINISDVIDVAHDNNLLLVSFIAVILQILTNATVYGFVPVAAKEIGASNFQLGLLTTLTTVPGAIASALSGTYFTKKIGEKNSIVIGFILNSLACLSIPFIGDINILMATQFVGGFGRGLVYPLLMSLSIKSIDPSKRATAMGFFQAIYGLGMFLGPVMVGVISDTAGLGWGFIAASLVGLAGAVVSGLYLKANVHTQSTVTTK